MHITGPRRFTFITRSQRFSGVLLNGAGKLMPALFTRMSTRPNSSRVRWAIACTCASSVTSVGMGRARPDGRPSGRRPAASTSRAVSSIVPGSFEGAFSLLRALTTTSAPARANSMAIARPMPRLAPVTTAT